MTNPPVCRKCGQRISLTTPANQRCPVCGKLINPVALMIVSVLFCFLFAGCDETRKPRTNPDNHDIVVINDVVDNVPTVKAIHKQSALVRADAYDALADAVDAGKVATVNDSMNFLNPLLIEAGKQYTIDVNKLRKERLGGAEEDLPKDAAAVYRKFAKEYRDAAK